MNRFFIVYSIFYLETLYGLQTVNLTEQDTTWIASGYQTRQISPIIITPCSNCTQYIQVMMRFEDGTQTKTDFTITDSEGSQIQSTTFNSTSLQLLHGPLTIIDRSAVGSYSLSFRLHNVTDSIALYASRLFTIVPNTPVPYTYQTKGSGNYGTFATFSAMPALYGRSSLVIKPTNKTTTGCEYSLFQAGYPATNRGLNAYRIHTFTPENSGDRFALSIIPAFAATIYVPPRCPVSIDVADYTSLYDGMGVFGMSSVPQYGFVMSRDFPGGMTGTGFGGMNVDLKYYLDSKTITNRSIDFNVHVDHFLTDPDSSVQFKFLYDEKVGYIFNRSTNSFSQAQTANSFRIQFSSPKTLATLFLLHFNTGDTPSMNSHSSICLFLVFILPILRYVIKA